MYQNCKFHISHHSEYVFSSLSIYFTLIAIVLKDYDAAFLCNCWFLFIIIMGLLICKYAPFWQGFSVKSLILMWPLRPVGLLFTQIFTYNFLPSSDLWISRYSIWVFFNKIDTPRLKKESEKACIDSPGQLQLYWKLFYGTKWVSCIEHMSILVFNIQLKNFFLFSYEFKPRILAEIHLRVAIFLRFKFRIGMTK